MSKNRKFYDLAEERALTIPALMWRFCAYKTEKDYESGEHYFLKDFLDHTKMKVFIAKHSAKEKSLYPEYCSMYWKIETNASDGDLAFVSMRDVYGELREMGLNSELADKIAEWSKTL